MFKTEQLFLINIRKNIHIMQKLEYIWLDGAKTQQIRTKTKVVNLKHIEDETNILDSYKNGLRKAPVWNFDGSSTYQAETSKSELLLVPKNYFHNPFTTNSILVLCEVYNIDGTPHESNTRVKMTESLKKYDDETMYGWEQEYFIFDNKTNRPLGWPTEDEPREQGEYYCSVGANNVVGREFVEAHTDLCLNAGISISGTNAEVALGQWEYQVGTVFAEDGADQLWISRYILHRLSEEFDYRIELEPKPFKGNDWNGSGMHVNFSTKTIREDKVNKKDIAIEMCKKLEKTHAEHIAVYGENNDERLTGANETSSIKDFGWGIGDRTKSIRIPSTINDPNAIGYIEDRRPASNGDPYLIVDRMVRTILQDEEVLEEN
jgi:glutamine synthetase